MLKNSNFRKIISFIIFISFISTVGFNFVDTQAAGVITYSGYVRNESGVGINAATVRLVVNDDLVPREATTTTSSSGYYSVSRSFDSMLSIIDIALFASKTGYIQEVYGDSVPSGSYSHNFYLEEATPPEPSLSWVSPANNALITFPPTSNDFTFSYSAANLDTVKLFIGPTGPAPTDQYGTDYTTMGSSVEKTVDLGASIDELHGMVRADLRGYEGASLVLEVTRTFNFSKQVTVEFNPIESGMEDLGSELYLIIYDPPGDLSYTSFTEQTKVTRTNEFTLGIEVGMEVELKNSLFNVGTDAKFDVDFGYELDCEWSFTEIDTLELYSSVNEDNRTLVGPGYGDLYWGEREVLLWEIYSTVITYADGVIEYKDPVLYFGVDYSENVLISHLNAPESWKQMNPNINNDLYSSAVTWNVINGEFEGGAGIIEYTHEEESSQSTSHEFTLGVSYETKVKFGIGSTTFSASIESSFKHDDTQTDSVKTLYHLQDDDVGDYFHYDLGTDLRFGVPIFRNHPDANPILTSKSSSPWEYGTRDYLPPESGEPTITYDTDLDGLGPTEGDTPLVEITITDEAEIDYAIIVYSDDGGSSWNTANMFEHVGEDDSWYGYIPSHEHETEISWHIFVVDENSNSKTIRDADENDFIYTIVSRPPTVELTTPNGGETLQDSVLIEWTGSDPDDDSLTYRIAYQIEGGGWVLIVEGLTNNSYLWDISTLADSDAVSIKVLADDSYCDEVSDTSDFVFTIDNIDLPSVVFNAPTSGLTYKGTVTVGWTPTDIDDYITGFELYYSIVSGEPSWILIDDIITDGIISYDWDTDAIIYSESVKLKIVIQNSLDETIETISGFFTLDNRPSMEMNLINPNGGEVFTNNCSISWNVDYDEALITYEVLLEYTLDGTNWFTIISGINGTSYLWNTTSMSPGTNYRVRIILTGSYLGVELDPIVDVSEGTFTIIPVYTIPSSTTENTSIPFFIIFAALIPLGAISILKHKKQK
ncbi:MAG: hypothetical protein EAX90_11915 [Candidatus Heimdallarchaeota archaeon]|nr:hypothetical protein [Candidatus Heimdallarchaeota archaeon]